MNTDRAVKRLTDLVDGLRSFEDPKRNKILTSSGKPEKMTDLQAKVFKAYARQIERVVEDDLT